MPPVDSCAGQVTLGCEAAYCDYKHDPRMGTAEAGLPRKS